MIFKYYNFKENLYKEVFLNCIREKQIFVFKSESEKNFAKFFYMQNFKFEDNLLITLPELKDMMFFSENPILREEKRILIFYKILNSDEREFFGIRTYFDCIDIANNFFILMGELGEACVTTEMILKLELNEKQKNIYLKFQDIKRRYETKLKELEFDDYILINTKEKLNISNISNYNKILFINIPHFTVLEKHCIEEISKSKVVELHISGYNGSFCEEKLRIKEPAFSADLLNKDNISVTVFEDKFIETVSLAEFVEEDKRSAVIECDSDGSLTRFLSVDCFSRENSEQFTESSLFKFLAGLYNIYSTLEIINGKRAFNAESLLENMLSSDFTDYFEISNIEGILSIINSGNKYLNSTIDQLSMLNSEIDKIEKIDSIGEFLTYLLSIDISKIKEKTFKNVDEVFHSAIFEMSSIESMNLIIKEEYDLFFGKMKQENIFRLVLKFLRFKKIKPSFEVNQCNNKIYDFKNCNFVLDDFDKIVFLNLNEGILPSKVRNNFLFSEQQRRDLGFITYDEKRNYEKFKFLSIVSSAKKAEIYTIYNENKNISISSFAEELILNAGVQKNSPFFKESDYCKIADSIYKGVTEYNFPTEKSTKKSDEIENIKIGYYDFADMANCQYKFYLKKIKNTGKTYPTISYSPEMAVIGIIVHDIFRIAMEKIKSEGFESFNENRAAEIIRERIKETKEKFPVSYLPYYEKIVAEHIAESIKEFLTVNRDSIEHAEIYPEKAVKKEIEDEKITLSGRVDLMTYKNGITAIFDYKTGGGNMEQLDFYQSIIEDDEESAMAKIIYSVFKMENTSSTKRSLNFDIIKDVVKKFKEGNSFLKSEEGKYCRYCDYIEICRPEKDAETDKQPQ